MNTKYEEKFKAMFDDFKKEQKNKFRKFVVFMVVLCLLISGITGVASYTLAANQVGYTARDTSWTVDNTQDAIDELRDTVGYALVGSIFSYMGNNAPFGYLTCDGTEYNIADYPRLAEHFTSEFGSANYFGGDGTTTFAVPNLQGEFLRGFSPNSSASKVSGVTTAAVGIHQDATAVPYYFAGTGDGMARNVTGTITNFDQNLGSVTNRAYGVSSSRSESYGSIYTSRPTNTSVLFIIKY